MKTYTKEELAQILDKHGKWLRKESGGERADLSSADLRSANLRSANLSFADLSSANLSFANLSFAKLEDFTFVDYMVIPEEGDFTAYKALRYGLHKNKWAIATLRIPTDAERVTAISSRKSRASRALVVSVVGLDGEAIDSDTFYGSHQKDFEYRVGREVIADSFDASPLNECSNGIHFFITKKEAIRWAKEA